MIHFFSLFSYTVICKFNRWIRGTIKKICLWHIFHKTTTNKSTYAVTLHFLKYKVLFHLVKIHFCYPILKPTCFITMTQSNVQTWFQDDTRTEMLHLLYHAASLVVYPTTSFKPHFITWHPVCAFRLTTKNRKYITWHIVCSYFFENHTLIHRSFHFFFTVNLFVYSMKTLYVRWRYFFFIPNIYWFFVFFKTAWCPD